MEVAEKTVAITGAAGNLGSRLARHLVPLGHRLRLMVHRTPLPTDLANAPNVAAISADLADPLTLPPVVAGADVVVHFAGVLFAPRPRKFLPETNTRWFSNLLDVCLEGRVGRVILISFPHVEGPTTVDAPASGRLDREPISVHARTRLEEERLLMRRTEGSETVPVVLRLGMVYGRRILMIEAAHWLARHDGRLWFTEFDGNRIGRITTAGAISELAPSPLYPYGITNGPDGNLWVTLTGSNEIARVTPTGSFTRYPVPTASALQVSYGIVAGPDGNVWFTEYGGNQIGRITEGGVVTEFALPNGNSAPQGIAVGSDGAIWFTEGRGNRIGRLVVPASARAVPMPSGLAVVVLALGLACCAILLMSRRLG